MVSSARPSEGELTVLPPGWPLNHPAASLSPGAGWRTEAVQPRPTDVRPVVEGGDGAPGLAQTCRGALGVTDSVVSEGENTGGVRRGTSHCPAARHVLAFRLLLQGAGALAVEVAVLPLVGDHHVVPVHLSGAPGSLRPPGVGAGLVSHPLVDEGKHTELT